MYNMRNMFCVFDQILICHMGRFRNETIKEP